MAIYLKNESAIAKMRVAGKIVARAHEEAKKYIKPGVSTYEIDMIIAEYIKSQGAVASFLDYNGYPASACVAVNDVIVHGIPSKKVILKEGDILGVDVGAFIDGFHGDAARTHMVGEVSEEARLLVERTKQSYFESIKYATTKNRLYDISNALDDYITPFGYGIVRDFIGHGIGKKLHESPEIPHYRMNRRGPRLDKGITLCVEPMINMGTHRCKVLEDGWTAVTADGSLSAHYENTLVVTDGEPEILTII
ncbi:MAG: type I methionyl aminopeptidase [Lachnospirales bacterium]